MPTITLDRKYFEEILGEKIPEKKLKERISMLGTDIESIDQNELKIEIFPDRPDMLSEQGFCRAFLSFLGKKKGIRLYSVKDSDYNLTIDPSVKKVRPHTACAVVKKLSLSDEKIKEIIQIQEKLHITYGRRRKKAAIGIYPLEKINFPITFKALPKEKIKFKPLEHDKELTGVQILNSLPTGREYAHLLENYDMFPLFEDNEGKILSMPPIINAHETGKITEATKDVFIECSGFNLDALKKCLNIIVTTLLDMGGEAYSVKITDKSERSTEKSKKAAHTFKTPELEPSEMNLDIEYVNKKLGLDLGENKIKECLEKMGYGYNNKKVLIPSYRVDILHPIDIVEDIAISYGYENFKEEIPNVATIARESPFEIFKDKVSEILVGLGVLETKTFNLISEKNQTDKMNHLLDKETMHLEDDKDNGIVKLAGCVNQEHNSLRKWMIPSLITTLSKNRHNEYPQNIFEIGTVFEYDEKEESRTKESELLGCMICNKEADFTKSKQVLDGLLNAMDIPYVIEESIHPSFIEGRFGKIIIDKKTVGIIGEIHPLVLENFELEMPCSGFELELDKIAAIKFKIKR